MTTANRQDYLDDMATSRTPAPGASRLGTLYCSFCRKDKGAVSKLIAGPGVYICNECVGLCNLILAEEKTPEFGAWNERPDDELLTGLKRIQAVVSQVDAAVYDYVDTLRGPRHQLDPHRGGARRVQAGGMGAVLRRGLKRYLVPARGQLSWSRSRGGAGRAGCPGRAAWSPGC